MSMLEYKVVRQGKKMSFTQKNEIVDFAKAVNNELADGWECQGGVTSHGNVMVQALVRKID